MIAPRMQLDIINGVVIYCGGCDDLSIIGNVGVGGVELIGCVGCDGLGSKISIIGVNIGLIVLLKPLSIVPIIGFISLLMIPIVSPPIFLILYQYH